MEKQQRTDGTAATQKGTTLKQRRITRRGRNEETAADRDTMNADPSDTELDSDDPRDSTELPTYDSPSKDEEDFVIPMAGSRPASRNRGQKTTSTLQNYGARAEPE